MELTIVSATEEASAELDSTWRDADDRSAANAIAKVKSSPKTDAIVRVESRLERHYGLLNELHASAAIR